MDSLPIVRADCAEGPRPCPHVECRYHLESELESCALDVADRGTHTLEEVGDLFGLTRERIRQIENDAIEKLTRRLVALKVIDPAETARGRAAESEHSAGLAWLSRDSPGAGLTLLAVQFTVSEPGRRATNS